MAAPNVCFVRPELASLLGQYRLIRDAIIGETAVKAAGQVYLPMPEPENKSAENLARYKSYLKRAVYYNVTRRTLNGLAGQVFMRDPIIEVPANLKPVIDDSNGEKVDITQLSKKALLMTLAYSRAGLLADYPSTSEGATVEELAQGKIRPVIRLFSPESIINWRTTEVGSETILSLVVIFERWANYDDGFEMKYSGQFRVLRLNAEGNYEQEIWREPSPTELKTEAPPKKGNYVIHEGPFTVTDFNGNPLKFIPFTFIGSENNDCAPDNPNLYDLASLNIAHYRNSADYEESCFVVGQPTPVATGLTEEWVNKILNGVLAFGSRGGIPLPEGATANLLQADPNTMIFEAMEAKERQMVALGAKLVEQKSVQRTAFETKVEATSDGSILSNTAKNVATAFRMALEWCSSFVNSGTANIKFELNTEFDLARITPEERRQVIEEWQKGAITFLEMRAVLRKAGTATEDDAKAETDIAAAQAEALARVEASLTGDPVGNKGAGNGNGE